MPYAVKILCRSRPRAAAAACKLGYCCPNSSQLSGYADADGGMIVPLLTGMPARMYSDGDFVTDRE